MITHRRCACHGARRNVQHRGDRFSIKRQICILISLPSAAVPEDLQPGGDHSALQFIEVPAVEIQRQHERQRVVAVEFEELGSNSGRLAGPKAIPAVEDHVLVDGDRLHEAVRFDVGDQGE